MSRQNKTRPTPCTDPPPDPFGATLPTGEGKRCLQACPFRPPPTARPRLETLMASLLWRLAVSRTGLRPAAPRRRAASSLTRPDARAPIHQGFKAQPHPGRMDACTKSTIFWGRQMSESAEDNSETGDLATVANQSEEFGQRMLEQAFEMWINPELERRRVSGALKEPFQLLMAQRLQHPDGNIIIRINDEVRGVASLRASRDLQKGEEVLLSDFQGLENFELEDEDLDSGHWTVFWTGKGWFTSFNFLTQRARCLDLLSKSSQFLAAATYAKLQKHPAVVVDTLFSACELIAKAQLVASHAIKLDVKSHSQVASQINLWRKRGNVEGAFVDLFNRLGQLRPRYRYDTTFSEDMPVSEDDLALVGQMIASGVERLRPKL